MRNDANVAEIYRAPNGTYKVVLEDGRVFWVPNDPANADYRAYIVPYLEAGGTVEPLPEPPPAPPESEGEWATQNDIDASIAPVVRALDSLVQSLLLKGVLRRDELGDPLVDVLNAQRTADGLPPL